VADSLVVAPDQMLSLPLIGFAPAAIFPATMMPQRVPATVVPAAIGFMTIASLGQPLSRL